MASGKTLQSTLEISGVLSPSLQAAINGAVDRLANMAEETLETADAASRLVVEMSEQEDILKTMQKAYAGYVASGEESSEQAQDLADRIRTVSQELDDNRDVLKAAEKAASRLTETQDEAADAYSKLERKISSQEDELAKLRRQYANVALEQGDSSEEAKRLEKRISDLSGELNQNKQKLNEAERAADSLGKALEDAGEKAESSGDGYTVLKNIIANLASEAISKAVEGFKELALEGDTALGKLEARTGAAGAKMEGFEDVMYEVYNANYGENLGDVSEKLSTIIQMTDDLDNASLAKVTKSAIALEDVFGFDVTESMRAVNSLMDQFGITSDQAFNLVVQGAQKGLNQNDDLLDVINEYSVQFKNAGYSADDMFNMLSNGVESGTWSVDKLGDAMKEFNIRMSDGTATEYLETLGLDAGEVTKQFKKGGAVSKKAIGTIMKAIMKCDDATLQYQTGVGLFGTMWEDLGADTVNSLMNTEGAISRTSDALDRMDSAAYDTFEKSLSKLGRTLMAEVVQPIAEELIPVMKAATEYITDKVAPAVDWMLDHTAEIGVALGAVGAVVAAVQWGVIVEKITEVIGVIKGVIAAIGAVSAVVWVVIAVVVALAAAFVNLWKNNEDFRNKMTSIWEEIKGKFVAFGQTITDKLNELGFDFENFGEVIRAIWDGICNILEPYFVGAFQAISDTLGFVLDTLVGTFDVFAGIFTGDWERVWLGIKEIFGAAWEFLLNFFKNWWSIFTGVADAVLGWFGTSWSEVWTSIRDFFVDTWNGMASFFSNVWNGITSFLSGAWNTIKNVVQFGIMAISSILSAAFNIITLPFRFIWENCKEYVFAAWAWIKTKVSAAVTAVKDVIIPVWNVIKSVTSTVWNAIKTVISAIWNAISSKVTVAINTVKSVITPVWNFIKSVTSTVWNSIKSTISGAWDNIKSRVSGAINSVRTIVSDVWSGIKSVTSTVWNGIKRAILSPIEEARDKIKGIVDKIKGFFSSLKLNLPKIKLPHFKVEGELSLSPPSVPKLTIDWYKDGGIMTRPTVFGAAGNTLMAGGEAGAEAILPLAVLWEKMEAILRRILSGYNAAGEPTGEGLTSKAGQLLALDNFSLGSLANNTNVVIYYDFSNFTWSPQIQTNGKTNDEDDFMAQLRAHEAEFFDWLEEFVQMREVAQYA